jgi:hypothetical protein
MGEQHRRRAGASVSEVVAALPAALPGAESGDDDVCLLALEYAPPG